MAILENRVKSGNNIAVFLLIVRKSLILIFISLSIFLLHFATPKKFSEIILEISGNFIAGGLKFYQNFFDKINILNENLVYFKNLKTENIELKLEISRLNKLQTDVKTLQSENFALRKLLHVVSEEKYDYITARLLSISLNPFSRTAIVGAGTLHGIKVDQIVTNNDGLIGRIIEVSENYSKIMLIHDFNSRIPIITSSSLERGILAGNGGNSKIIYLQKNHNIKKGEKIITSGDGAFYPSGIEVAKVKEVDKNEVLVEPIANLCKTVFVNIHGTNIYNSNN